MALNWEWDNRIGTCDYIFSHGEDSEIRKINIYGGNALAIFCDEWKNDGHEMYQVCNFFCDEEHAKRMLGMDKKYNENVGIDGNRMEGTYFRFDNFELLSGNKKSLKLMSLLIKAKWKNGVSFRIVNELPEKVLIERK